jgi:thiamine-phosphate pyrophosphorylase
MMRKRHSSLPRLWLMTDERMGDALLPSVAALPKGSGVLFRHYSLGMARRSLFDQVRSVCRKRRHKLIVAGMPKLARTWGAVGAHGQYFGTTTAPVHSVRERLVAERAGAKLIFVSPIFATATHIRHKGLGRVRFGMISSGAKVPVIALGGMTRDKARALSQFGIYGWAAIDALTVRI